ncbi:MAG: hypothetical protein K0R06_1459 [Clostridium sp.]|nr:hypothetical protein [Clostridium sp.]
MNHTTLTEPSDSTTIIRTKVYTLFRFSLDKVEIPILKYNQEVLPTK